MNQTRLRAVPAVVTLVASGVALASGPALAASITKCTTIAKPGSYVLTGNLSAAGDCLVVAADFVTIDLGGWVIAGDGSTGAGVTDQGASRRGIAVHNGTVTGFQTGVRLVATSGAGVEEVRAIDNEVSGISTGVRSTVRGNIAFSSPFGIVAGQFSTISGNTAAGFESALEADAGSTISDNTVEGTTGISAGPGSTISGNTVTSDDLGQFSPARAAPSATIPSRELTASLPALAAAPSAAIPLSPRRWTAVIPGSPWTAPRMSSGTRRRVTPAIWCSPAPAAPISIMWLLEPHSSARGEDRFASQLMHR